MHPSSIRSALASAFQIPLRPAPAAQIPRQLPKTSPTTTTLSQSSSLANAFHISARAQFSTTLSRPKKAAVVKTDRRITLIRYFLHHPSTLTPRPLRFSRNRSLRHWTITRAWNLYRHKLKKDRELELERQYNAMAAANEELRIAIGDGGRLFRKAQMKTGIWSIPERGGGVPIEYARGLVEWVGSTGGLGVGAGNGGREGEDVAQVAASAGAGTEPVGGSKAKIWDSEWKRH